MCTSLQEDALSYDGNAEKQKLEIKDKEENNFSS